MRRRVFTGHCSRPKNDLQTIIIALGNLHSLDKNKKYVHKDVNQSIVYSSSNCMGHSVCRPTPVTQRKSGISLAE